MSNATKNEVVQATPMDMAINNKFINQLTEQLGEKEKYGLTFPDNYNVSNALNSAYLILQDMTVKKNEKGTWVEYKVLDLCTKQSVSSALMDMAIQGLSPSKKQCYFILMGNKLTLMRSYQGTMGVAKRCGVTRTPNAQVIYEGDIFKYHIENGLCVIEEHTQDFMNIDNEKIKGAYAVLETIDGQYVEIMNINQIKKAWAKGKGYDPMKPTDVHNEFPDQMAKKTVLGRACKNLINSSDDANLTEVFNNTSENEDIDKTVADVTYEIEENANTEPFQDADIQDADFKEVEADIVEKSVEKAKETKASKDVVADDSKLPWNL